jgi:hypothetical protein
MKNDFSLSYEHDPDKEESVMQSGSHGAINLRAQGRCRDPLWYDLAMAVPRAERADYRRITAPQKTHGSGKNPHDRRRCSGGC